MDDFFAKIIKQSIYSNHWLGNSWDLLDKQRFGGWMQNYRLKYKNKFVGIISKNQPIITCRGNGESICSKLSRIFWTWKENNRACITIFAIWYYRNHFKLIKIKDVCICNHYEKSM